MLLPRSQPPIQATIASIGRVSFSMHPHVTLFEAFAQLNVCRTGTRLGSIRHASHKAQGAVNKAKDGPGKRLGAKKSGEQYVIPGNIIFRQRGTHWFPGDNCAMGRDHTIYATESGYVKYYKDPLKHPKRQYIGVTFERGQMLPVPRNAPRKRRLGMLAVKMETSGDGDEGGAEVQTHVQTAEVEGEDAGGEQVVEVLAPLPVVSEPVRVVRPRKERRGEEGRNLQLRPGYQYREGNWEIGRAAERANVKVRDFKPSDRWAAWRKTTARKAKNVERRGLSRKGKK